MSELTRRRVVAVAGAAGTAAVAGCLGAAAGDATNESTGDRPTEADAASETGTVLGEIGVENLDDDEHTVDVLVEYEGEIEHWSTHELNAESSGATLEGEWPTEAGEFRVTARLDGDAVEQATAAKWNDPACLNLVILVGRDGEIRTAGDTAGGACESLEAGDGAGEPAGADDAP